MKRNRYLLALVAGFFVFSFYTNSVYGSTESNSYTGLTAGTFAAKYKDVIPKDGKIVYILVKVQGEPQSLDPNIRAKEIRFLQSSVLKFVAFAGAINTKSSKLNNEFSTYVHPKIAELLEQRSDVISVRILDTLSPKKQLSFGSINVVCKNGYELIFKKYDGIPACVTQVTAKRLVEIGWGRINSEQNKVKSIFEPTNSVKSTDSVSDSASVEREETILKLHAMRHSTFNEGQPIVFVGKLTSQSDEKIENAAIVIKSDGSCPTNHIIANGTTGGDGRFWILTTAKIWDESDNMIKTYAEYGGSERFSPSISNIQIIVV
ncbi:MAG: hypothetical protein ACRD9Q_01175, partial [Nitrososphaeraceae archaeon]